MWWLIWFLACLLTNPRENAFPPVDSARILGGSQWPCLGYVAVHGGFNIMTGQPWVTCSPLELGWNASRN